MYLNAEEWIGKENWQGAIDECDKVMQLDYIIEPNWKTNFQVHNEVSKEAILPICYTASQWGNLMHLYTLHYLDPIALGFKGDMWNGINAKPDFVYSFAEDDPRKEYTFLIGPMIDPETKEVLITSANRPLIHTIDLHVIPGTEKQMQTVIPRSGVRFIKKKVPASQNGNLTAVCRTLVWKMTWPFSV